MRVFLVDERGRVVVWVVAQDMVDILVSLERVEGRELSRYIAISHFR
jgi:hypothetical protein